MAYWYVHHTLDNGDILICQGRGGAFEWRKATPTVWFEDYSLVTDFLHLLTLKVND